MVLLDSAGLKPATATTHEDAQSKFRAKYKHEVSIPEMYMKASYEKQSSGRFISAWWRDKNPNANAAPDASFVRDNTACARDIHAACQRFRTKVETHRHGLIHSNISFVGFGQPGLRDAICNLLRYYLRARLIHCTMTGPGRFEGLLIVWLPTDAGEALGDLQQIFDQCRAGLVLIDLGSYMSALMGACLRRVLAGTTPWGNLFSRKNASVHRDYETFVRGDNDAATVTGLSATPDNMLGLFHSNRILRFQLMALMGADTAWQQYHRQIVTSHARLAQALAVSGTGMMPEVRAAAEAHEHALLSLPWV